MTVDGTPSGRGGGATATAPAVAAAAGGVLFALSCGQFVMTLDTSVMNVAIADVARDVGTTITGIQTAITLYALVMATLMITGGKIGSIIGRRRAFSIGCLVYGAGSLTTALSPNLTVLLVGWSGLEGIGAALIMPAIVALVASNFPPEGRPRAYGLVASAGAIAVAAGPLIGGLVTTYATWRWVFAGEVLVVIAIVLYARKFEDAPPTTRSKLDLVGTGLSALGLGLAVYGVLRSGEWGWVQPKAGGPEWLGLSPTAWLVLAGITVIYLFGRWETRVAARGREPLVRPGMLRNQRLRTGLTLFFFQYFIQGGLFFVVPLFLSIVVGLSAAGTGTQLMPLSITLLLAAIAIPRYRPHASPRRVVRAGVAALLVAVVALIGAMELGAGAGITTVPLLIAGLGIGALASQLGSVTVSSVADEESGEVGGLQNTATNLGTSIGTALVGSVLIATLSATFVSGITENPKIPQRVSSQVSVELASGMPFISDDDLESALVNANVRPDTASAIVDENAEARIVALRASLAIVALFALLALFFTGRLPTVQAADERAPQDVEPERARAPSLA